MRSEEDLKQHVLDILQNKNTRVARVNVTNLDASDKDHVKIEIEVYLNDDER